jgi:hypothetical protein
MTEELAKFEKNEIEKSFKENVDDMIANREYFREKLEGIMKEKEDYFVIMGKKSLAKGGAEKLASGFKLVARFEIDEKAQEIFKNVAGLIAYRCTLHDNKGIFKGEGGGADTLQRNQNDPNKTIKMAQKRAYVDAVIRTTGLSDIFTQDLEDMGAVVNYPTSTPKTPQRPNLPPKIGVTGFIADPHKPASDAQKYKIRKMLDDLGLNYAYVESKMGPIETMKMGMASQAIEQLQKKIDNVGSPAKPSPSPEFRIAQLCEVCECPLTESEQAAIEAVGAKYKCKKCVIATERPIIE